MIICCYDTDTNFWTKKIERLQRNSWKSIPYKQLPSPSYSSHHLLGLTSPVLFLPTPYPSLFTKGFKTQVAEIAQVAAN